MLFLASRHLPARLAVQPQLSWQCIILRYAFAPVRYRFPICWIRYVLRPRRYIFRLYIDVIWVTKSFQSKYNKGRKKKKKSHNNIVTPPSIAEGFILVGAAL